MALVLTETAQAIALWFSRSVASFVFGLTYEDAARKGARVGWANFDFGPPGLDFLELGRHFQVAGTLN